MPFTATVTRSPEYVRYEVAGPTCLKNFIDLLAFAGAETEHYEDVKVLLDLRGVVGRLTSAEQFLLGEVVALKLPLVYKLASLVPPGEISRNSERAALSKGVTVRVFDSEPEAMCWLLEGNPD